MSSDSPPSSKSLDLLESDVKERLDFFSRYVVFNRRMAFGLRMSTAALTATVTVLLGIKYFHYPYVLANLALFLSGVATVLAAWEAFWSNRELWLVFQDGSTAMNKLKSDIAYAKAAGSLSQCQFDTFRQEYQKIVDEFNAAWKKARNK